MCRGENVFGGEPWKEFRLDKRNGTRGSASLSQNQLTVDRGSEADRILQSGEEMARKKVERKVVEGGKSNNTRAKI